MNITRAILGANKILHCFFFTECHCNTGCCFLFPVSSSHFNCLFFSFLGCCCYSSGLWNFALLIAVTPICKCYTTFATLLKKINLNLNAPASSGPVSVLLLVGLPAAVPLAKHDDEEEGAQPADAAPEAKDAADYGLNEKGKLLFLLQIVAL